jgi:hypothetical protein
MYNVRGDLQEEVMKSLACRIALTAVTVSLLLLFYSYNGQRVVAQNHTPVTITRLYTGDDGLSHVEQVEVKFSPVAGAPPAVGQSDPVKTTNSYVVRLAPGFFESWHNADKRRYVVTLSGRAEIEVAGGQRFLAEPGKIVLAEDLSGKGHTFRVVGTEDWVAVFVEFAE